MKTVDFEYLFKKISSLYPQAKCELVFDTPFQLLVAVILSAQSTDKQVNLITQNLFIKIKTPKDVVNFWLENFINSIKSIWLFKTKWANIFRLSKILINKSYQKELMTKAKLSKSYQIYNEFWYFLPEELDDFVKLPWIWPKTAKIILNHIFEIPYVPADTHVHRVTNRLWILQTKLPEKTSEILEQIIPEKFKLNAHILLVYFGRYHCKSIKPKCEICPFTKLCKHYLEN